MRTWFAGAAVMYCSALAAFFAWPSVFAQAGTVYTTGVKLAPPIVGTLPGEFEIQAYSMPNFTPDGAFLDLSLTNNLVLTPALYTAGIGHVW